MNDLSKIKRSIRRIAGGGSRWCFTAKVKSVDGEVCSVETEGLTLTDVRLRAVVNGEESKMLVTPKTESYVTVLDVRGDMRELLVVAVSEVEKVEVSEVEKVEVTAEKVIFNGGNNGGLINIDKLTEKLNALVKELKAHTHNYTIGTTSIATTPPVITTTFSNSDYEDTNVTH